MAPYSDYPWIQFSADVPVSTAGLGYVDSGRDIACYWIAVFSAELPICITAYGKRHFAVVAPDSGYYWHSVGIGSETVMSQRVILVIMDGYGIRKGDYNAVTMADTPHLRLIFRDYPNIQIQASGLAVGLPEGQMGNSEVGHLNIGAGRVVYQDITRIDLSIQRGEFFQLPLLMELANTLKQTNKALHLVGLVSDGCVHSSMEHLYALIRYARDNGIPRLYVHALMDGRDTPPHGGVGYIQQVEAKLKEFGVGAIATVMGRYYGMDRDKRWDRTEKAYQALVAGEGLEFSTAEEAVKDSYARDVSR